MMVNDIPDGKAQGAYMRPIWGRQDPGGSHVGRIGVGTLCDEDPYKPQSCLKGKSIQRQTQKVKKK